jgi:hypothetical protein
VIGNFLLGAVSFGALTYFFFQRRSEPVSLFHEKLAVGLFSVMVTTVVVVISLSLPQDYLNQISGKVGFTTFTLAGPPAIWAMVFVITARVFDLPIRTAGVDHRINVLGPDIRSHYKSLGWHHYRDWRADPNSYQRVIEKSESHFINDLLPKVFYHGPHDLLKPKSITNSTIFFFSRKGAVKFQRIQGEACSENGKRSEIYLPQTSSTPEGLTTCLHFIRNGNRLAQTGRHTHGEWKIAPFKKIDILLVAVYENDELEDGDYVYVDVSKYVDQDSLDSASLDLVIVSDRQIEEYNVWEVAPSLVSREKPVPLMFHSLDSQINKRTADTIKTNLERASRMLGGWEVVLDQASKGVLGSPTDVSREMVEEFFQKVKNALGDYAVREDKITFQELFTAPAKDCVITRLKHQQNVILSTFTWC